MNIILNEDSRNTLISNTKKSRPYSELNQFNGKNRYQRRLKSRLASSIKHFNNINMDKFFKSDILDVCIDVTGETNEYVVRISFIGTLDEIHNFISTSDVNNMNNVVDRRTIARSLTRAFNKGDVYINCTCPDFHYRHKYWATRNNLLIGEPESRPNQYDWTNKNNDMGPVCKHITLALSDASWIIKVASVVYNYINYMKDHNERLYEKYIFPVLYQIPYEDDQVDIENEITIDNDTSIDLTELQGFIDYDMANDGRLSTETMDLIDKLGMSLVKSGDSYELKGVPLSSSPEDIEMVNKLAREKGRFKKGNEFRFKSKPKQFSFDELEDETENENEEI